MKLAHESPSTPDEQGKAAAKSRSSRWFLWLGGALLLVAFVLFQVWVVRFFVRQHAQTNGRVERHPGETPLPAGSVPTGQMDYARADSVSIILSNPVVEQGIQLVVLDSDPTTPEVIEGVECHQLMRRPMTYAYFTIDPSFKLTKQFDLEAEVEFFDASSGRLRLQYDAAIPRAGGRNYSTPRRAILTASREWKTNRFWMPDVRFENRLYAGADLRVEVNGPDFYLRRITLRRHVPVRGGPYAQSNEVSITLGSNVVSHGLVLGHDPDSVKYPRTMAGKDCHFVQRGPTGSGYLYLAVDPSWKAAHPGPCSVEVEYYSERTDRFRIEYDGESNSAPSEYEATPSARAAAGVWATNVFDLPTPRFRNAQNGETDFRLNTFSNPLFVRRVTLRPAQQ